uniref:Protein NO VEIN C-terminal domain-containing protein n=1 Tax=Schizophyllum commune (strain H4-8 / FGSC 9210) TaxID=578458 RepID=D8Q195_SCHCM
MPTMSASSPFRHARPPLYENTGSTARDYLMLERNLLTHLKLALLLSVVASSVLLKAKIVPSEGNGSSEGGRRSGWLALASFEFAAALFTIGAAVWQYFDASEDMRRARPFMESSRRSAIKRNESLMSAEAQKLIEEIRDGYGSGRSAQAKMQQDPSLQAVIGNLTTTLENACRNVSEDLYAKSPHFILEMVQNADDNKYAEGTKPTLTIRIEDDAVTFSSNELGFEPANVRAICSVGKSTKKGMSGRCYVGFKSCFKVADVVHIASRDFQFKFDKREKLGMITPIWCTDHPVTKGQTTFRLELSPGESGAALAEHASKLEPSLLLFLRQLNTLKVETALSGQNPQIIHFKYRTTNDPDVITLTRWEDHRTTRDTYFIVHHTVQGMPEEEKRRGINSTEVTLAFPIDKEGAPQARAEYAHAFLPLRKYGFKFIIQADFLTPASREDILEEKPWNITLRNGLLAAVLAAIERLKIREAMKFTWFRFLPLETDVSNGYFKPLVANIRHTLAAKSLFLSQDGEYHTAGQLLILPDWAAYQEKEDDKHVTKPLIPEQYLPFVWYLHSSYDTSINGDGPLLEGLRLKRMNSAQFINALQAMVNKRAHEGRSPAWFNAVYDNLYRIYDEPSNPNQKRGRKSYPYQTPIEALKLIPLSDGTWASKVDGLKIYFDFNLGDIPDDLGLYRLRPSTDLSFVPRAFYHRMGVQAAKPADIAKQLIERHRHNPPTELAALIKHARFLFTHRETVLGAVSLGHLRVMDSRGDLGHGKDMYLPGESSGRLENVLPSPPARFLHTAYIEQYSNDPALQKKWLKWLSDVSNGLGLHTSPRVTADGKLSEEAALMLEKVNTRQLLAILKRHWSGDRGSTRLSRDAQTQISNTLVECGGVQVQLRQTYIKRNSLADDTSGLPFLPLDEPENPEWDFLRRFGVSSEINGSFYLRQLKGLQSQGEALSEEDMNALYRQLETRFNDDAVAIREAFHTLPLIYNYKKKEWCAFADAVWTGPANMRFKTAVQTLYPHQEAFYCRCLQLAKPSHADLIVNEVKQLVSQLRDENLAEGKLKEMIDLLTELSRFIHKNPEEVSTATSPLHALRSEPIFPVRLPDSGDVALRRVTDQPFYVPDASEQFMHLFDQFVPMLAISSVQHTKMRALLECKIFDGLVRLEDAVQTENPVLLKKRRDDKLTKSYHAKREYFVRFCFAHHGYKPPKQVKDFLCRLKSFKIFVAEHVGLTYSLGDVKRTVEAEMYFNEKQFFVYLDKRQVVPAYNHQLHIAGKLASLFEMNEMDVMFVIQNASGALDQRCRNQKIPSLDDDAFDSFEWLREANDEQSGDDSDELEDEEDAPAATQAGGSRTTTQRGRPKQSQRTQRVPSSSRSASPEAPAPTQSARRRSGQTQPVHPLPTPRPSTQPTTPGAVEDELEEEEEEVQEDQFGEDDIEMLARGAKANAHLVRQHMRDRSGRRRGVKRKAAQDLSGSAAKRAREEGDGNGQGGASGSAAGADAKDEEEEPDVEIEVEEDELDEEEDSMQVDPIDDIPDDAPQRVIDVMGEHYFGAENWTSARRGHIPDFEPYEGDAVGNITYKDVQGELTRYLRGGQDVPTWANAYPTYHILVKTTTGAHETPFTLSEREVAAAMDMSMPVGEDAVPTDLLVVMRVSGPRGSQKLQAIVTRLLHDDCTGYRKDLYFVQYKRHSGHNPESDSDMTNGSLPSTKPNPMVYRSLLCKDEDEGGEKKGLPADLKYSLRKFRELDFRCNRGDEVEVGDPDAPLPGPDDERFEVLMGAGFMGVAGVDMVFVMALRLVVCALGLGAGWSGLGMVGCTARGWLNQG